MSARSVRNVFDAETRLHTPLRGVRTRLRLNGAIFRIMSLQGMYVDVYENIHYIELSWIN